MDYRVYVDIISDYFIININHLEFVYEPLWLLDNLIENISN